MSIKPVSEILSEAWPMLANLRNTLVAARDAAPDLADEINAQIAALDAIVDSTDLLALGQTVISELKNIAHIGLSGASHPHTVTGG